MFRNINKIAGAIASAILFFPPPLPKLITINDILPQHVTTGGDGGQWMQVGGGHPNGEDGVLLTEGLTGTDAVVVSATDALAEEELHHAGEEATEGNEPCRGIATEQRTGGLSHDQRQGECPDVEGHAAMLHQPTVYGFQKMFQEQRHEEWGKQQRENLAQYLQESTPKGKAFVRLYQREDQRHHDRTQEVGKQGVGGERGGIASELARNHGSCRGGRTNEAHHHPFPNASAQLAHGDA